MPYLFNTEQDVREMLAAIGVSSIDELFDFIPADARLNRELDLPAAMSELQLTQHMHGLASQNLNATNATCFLGGGSYDHFIPAVVDTLASRGEFYTSYTPYQPEVSQGNLQAMFEYQTLICELTGMDVSNASLYDGGTAAVEAVLLCLATQRNRTKVVVAGSVHPEYRAIISTYLADLEAQLIVVDAPRGVLSSEDLAAVVDDATACVLVQHPNFFGCLEPMDQIRGLTESAGALLVQVFDPMSLGQLKRPGDLGVDVAVAEGQGMGNPMAYGGPYLGVMTCREKFVRRMPGRIAGQTMASNDRRCWVLTLQTREQHIRREKATSNICTNQGLFALRSCIYLAAMGPAGMQEASELCLQKAHYAAERICQNQRYELAFHAPFFKEFVIRDRENNVASMLDQASRRGILAGVPLSQFDMGLDDCFLVAVTEKRTKQEIDSLVECLACAETSTEVIHA